MASLMQCVIGLASAIQKESILGIESYSIKEESQCLLPLMLLNTEELVEKVSFFLLYQRAGSAGKALAAKSEVLSSILWDPHIGRKEVPPRHCLLTAPHTHTHTHK